MAKDSVQFARIASPEEIAEYLTSLAEGLKRGEVTLEAGEQGLRLTPGAEIKVELTAMEKESRGKVEIEIGWKRLTGGRTSALRVEVGRPAGA